MGQYFKQVMPAIFIMVIMLVVTSQYNSNKSIELLNNGNQALLEVLKIKNNLQLLKARVLTMESRGRGIVISENLESKSLLDGDIQRLRDVLSQLNLSDKNPSIKDELNSLNGMVELKINFTNDIIQKLVTHGKEAAEELISTGRGDKLTDSIRSKANEIDAIHEQSVEILIKEAEKNAIKAKTFGSLLAIIASIVTLFTFVFVALKVYRQQQDIQLLNESEKKTMELANLKETFLANISHEMRTPMNAMLGFSNLLGHRKLDPVAREYVNLIRQSGENLLILINDILDISKIEAGMMRINVVPFSIRSVVDSSLAMLEQRAADKNVYLRSNISDEVMDSFEGDPQRLTQILVNLIGNGIKFTESGGVTLDISVDSTISDQVFIRFEISDTGIGIEQKMLPAIFERFKQLESDVMRKYGGTGLGLSIVKDLVHLQNGTLEVESTIGAGTRFVVTIPYRLTSVDQEVNSDNHQLKLDAKLIAGKKFLIVEDNKINQQLISQMLAGNEIKMDIAENGLEALEFLRMSPYDLVLMDLQMPEMDGYTATKMIRNELKLDLPIIATTAHALAGEKEKCLRLGMNGYLSKPISELELLRMIASLLKDSEEPNFTEQLIDLSYLREVSGGDTSYERRVTRQFIELFPQDLDKLQEAWDRKDARYRKIAHDLKTTISVMGLNRHLNPILSSIEHDYLQESAFRDSMLKLRKVCERSIQEANSLVLASENTMV